MTVSPTCHDPSCTVIIEELLIVKVFEDVICFIITGQSSVHKIIFPDLSE